MEIGYRFILRHINLGADINGIYREKLVKTIQSGEVDYKDIREIIEYNENVDNYNVEQLSARILFDLTRNTGFEVSKGNIGECWIKSCCEWKE